MSCVSSDMLHLSPHLSACWFMSKSSHSWTKATLSNVLWLGQSWTWSKTIGKSSPGSGTGTFVVSRTSPQFAPKLLNEHHLHIYVVLC